ncbi:hypothetical protein EDF64_10839 [Curtobacterium flaccumfaciens]|uniref:Uncharacterized protein n=1 Tax=Curtobacterium flaccumfaciens TaxID=2035 RepID=A0A4R6DH31_9MICO|nr:hypothetical protein [Curtobacterium flaccumfaciens]TDN43369.1 hypothetical protein EDF64_10839 [Curtobacterium flaccumfaciens]
MVNLVLNGALRTQTSVADGIDAMRRRVTLKQDRVVVLILVAVAIVIALGLVTAWWIACQNKGMYPAMDMPSFSAGGTWKLYCKK